jgi:hypothetical protein
LLPDFEDACLEIDELASQNVKKIAASGSGR